MVNILVIGCVSSDIIHLQNHDRLQTFETIGGAGLFTALAAAQSGASVTLYAPKPKSLTPTFAWINEKIRWIGPLVDPEGMPTLEITHHGGGRATLQNAGWGAEQLLTPANLPDLETDYHTIHIAALSTAIRQIDFIYFFADRYPAAKLSAGTYARSITADRATVQNLSQKCHFFFMNSNEAQMLYPEQIISPAEGQLIFVTDGKNGCSVYSSKKVEKAAAADADEIDPTGAGDTFCGATLACLARDHDLLSAVNTAGKLAAQVIEQPGCNFYLKSIAK